jgi:SAM-dependent methyltransferase
MQNTHAFKAQSYDLGRPEYPQAFYDWLYGEFGLGQSAVIADIGCGTGKITKGFLERGNKAYAVEPDDDMRRIAQDKLSVFPGCTVLGNNAEDTGIPSVSIDLIFCGNSYMWFDRARVVPEFKRILKSNGVNVILAKLHSINVQIEGLPQYEQPGPSRQANTSPPFKAGAFETKEFEYTLHQDWTAFLNGCLSTSFSPNPQNACFEKYCAVLRGYFDRHSQNETLETQFRLSCTIGSASDLIL